MTQQTIHHVVVIGLGKVGTMVAWLLKRSGFDVLTIDHISSTFPDIDHREGDINDPSFLKKTLKGKEAVISCLPFHLNKLVARAAYDSGIHYFDLTEDVATTQTIRRMADTSKGVMAPQCGLAPGLVSIIGADLCKHFKSLRSVELRVGALPQNPKGLIGYAFNWSPKGVVNEYLNDCEVIRDGKRMMVPAMQDLENIVVKGVQLEAFSTSGGLGTMCESFEGKVSELNYKTLRYPGHHQTMRCFFHELQLREDRELAGEILVHAKPPVNDDVVYIHIAVEGINRQNQLFREEYVKGYFPLTLDNYTWRAIAWTTAASVVSVVELVRDGKLPNQGFLKQEEIPFSDFLETKAGALYGVE